MQLNQLRRACKLKEYSVRVNNQGHTYIVGEDDVIITVSEEDTQAGHPRGHVHRVRLAGDNQVYKQGWVVNGDARKCMHCKTRKFGVFTWKHHCRLCGDVICGSCSSKSVDLEESYSLGESGRSRVCKSCYIEYNERGIVTIEDDDELEVSSLVCETGCSASGGAVTAEVIDSDESSWRDSGNEEAAPCIVTAVTKVMETKCIEVASNENEVCGATPQLAGSVESLGHSPLPTGVPILAESQEAPTPTPKSKRPQVTLARSPLAPIAFDANKINLPTSKSSEKPKGILKNGNKHASTTAKKSTSVSPKSDSGVSPKTRAILNSLDSTGRWDREDTDATSTPGSVLTPERAIPGSSLKLLATPASAGGDKYFFTPSGGNDREAPLSPGSQLAANTKANQSLYSPSEFSPMKGWPNWVSEQ